MDKSLVSSVGIYFTVSPYKLFCIILSNYIMINDDKINNKINI